ncbi:hypothetical protein EG68_08457 [Paragonimus skrjabini miyazakii]|uniref:DUF5641 domain-containing protein n=1 Tax=Paragonimus skrjabini miyazakii TaxID=59628 RepID=A0A8S9YHT7_9TREM|nr:hypothetical protein EG68_08457 [Paragonimus skrjabini miyazakii]
MPQRAFYVDDCLMSTSTANRLSSIHDLSRPDDRRYVDIKRNPADLNSRGMHPKDQRTGVWFNGSELLWLTERGPKKQTQVLTTLDSVSVFRCFSLPCSWSTLLQKIARLYRICGYVAPSFLRRHQYLLIPRPIPSGSVLITTDPKLTRRWRQAQQLADVVWSRWIKEYVPDLQKQQKWTTQVRELAAACSSSAGDQRVSAKKTVEHGKVDQSVVGRDGAVREALVRTENGSQRRGFRQLCLLEYSGANQLPDWNVDISSNSSITILCFANLYYVLFFVSFCWADAGSVKLARINGSCVRITPTETDS